MNPRLTLLPSTALGFLLVLPAVALGADKGEGTPLDLGAADAAATKGASAGVGAGSIVRTIVGLAVVIGVIYGLHWVLKQAKGAKRPTAEGTGLSELASLPLGTGGRTLHLVRAGDDVLLVGAGEGGVNALRHFDEHEARALGLIAEDREMEEVVVADVAPVGVLGGRLGAALGRLGQGTPRSTAVRGTVVGDEPIGAASPTSSKPKSVSGVVEGLRKRTVIR